MTWEDAGLLGAWALKYRGSRPSPVPPAPTFPAASPHPTTRPPIRSQILSRCAQRGSGPWGLGSVSGQRGGRDPAQVLKVPRWHREGRSSAAPSVQGPTAGGDDRPARRGAPPGQLPGRPKAAGRVGGPGPSPTRPPAPHTCRARRRAAPHRPNPLPRVWAALRGRGLLPFKSSRALACSRSKFCCGFSPPRLSPARHPRVHLLDAGLLRTQAQGCPGPGRRGAPSGAGLGRAPPPGEAPLRPARRAHHAPTQTWKARRLQVPSPPRWS